MWRDLPAADQHARDVADADEADHPRRGVDPATATAAPRVGASARWMRSTMSSHAGVGIARRTSALRSRRRAPPRRRGPSRRPAGSCGRARCRSTTRRRRRPARPDSGASTAPSSVPGVRAPARVDEARHERGSPARDANRRRTVVGEPRDRAQAGARAAGGRVAVLHAAARIGHAAAAVQRQHLEPGAAGVVARTGVDVPAAAVLHQVGGRLGDDDRHLRRCAPAGNPRRRASSPTARRASATWLASVTAVNILRSNAPASTTVPWPGVESDVELVGQPLGAAQAEAQAAAGRVAVLQRQRRCRGCPGPGRRRSGAGRGAGRCAAPRCAACRRRRNPACCGRSRWPP